MADKSVSSGDIPLSDRLVGETLAEYRSRLAPFTDQPALESLLLLVHTTGLPKVWLLAHPESVLTTLQVETAESLIQQRIEWTSPALPDWQVGILRPGIPNITAGIDPPPGNRNIGGDSPGMAANEPGQAQSS